MNYHLTRDSDAIWKHGEPSQIIQQHLVFQRIQVLNSTITSRWTPVFLYQYSSAPQQWGCEFSGRLFNLHQLQKKELTGAMYSSVPTKEFEAMVNSEKKMGSSVSLCFLHCFGFSGATNCIAIQPVTWAMILHASAIL